jgi:CubicO group peptidase (beta-lactamase class C family)
VSQPTGLADAVAGAIDGRLGPTAVSFALVRRGSETPSAMTAGWTCADGEGITPRPVEPGTRFDLASVSKLVTTLAVMRLRASGALDLDAPVRSLLPKFAGGAKDAVTVRSLLLHRAGLWEWWPLYADAEDGPGVVGDPAAAIARAAALPLRYRPDSGRHYSDLGFQLLGAIVTAVHGADLRTAVASLVTEPLGLRETGYGPVAVGVDATSGVAVTSRGDSWERQMIATGEPYPVPVRTTPVSRSHWLRGEVNDGNAHHAFGGAAGHAGIFSTAGDTARIGAVLFGGHPDWPPSVVAEFSAAGPDPEQALGWRRTEAVTAGGTTVTVLGHPGFTGTELSVAPSLGVSWALLTNRLHPTSTPVDVSASRARVARVVLSQAG